MTDATDFADRPASKEPEIVVTPEMIEAGVAALSECMIDGDLGSSRECLESAVISVFRDMTLRMLCQK